MKRLHPRATPAADSEGGRAAAGSEVLHVVAWQDGRRWWLPVHEVKRGGGGNYGERGRVTLGASRNKR